MAEHFHACHLKIVELIFRLFYTWMPVLVRLLLFIYLFIYLFICLFVYLFIYLFIFLLVNVRLIFEGEYYSRELR